MADDLDRILESSELRGQFWILHLKGNLDAHGTGPLSELLQADFPPNVKTVVFDFQNVQYVSSSGVWLLLGFVEKGFYCERNGADCIIVALRSQSREVLSLLGVADAFRYADSVDEALKQAK